MAQVWRFVFGSLGIVNRLFSLRSKVQADWVNQGTLDNRHHDMFG